MEVKAKFTGAAVDLMGRLTATFQIIDKEIALTEIDKFYQKPDDELDLTVKKHRNKRSLNANAMLWSCINKIAGAVGDDPWTVYLRCLEMYGQFTYIQVRDDAVDRVKEQWRECREVGCIEMKEGKKYIELLCFYGSSTYDSHEFARLLDGVIDEMKNLMLPIPATRDVQKALDTWEKEYERRKA